MPQADTWGAFSRFSCFASRVNEIGRAKALWKVPELWKNQKTVFPQLLGPSVHTSHNAGCYWTFLKHNFPSTPQRLELEKQEHTEQERLKRERKLRAEQAQQVKEKRTRAERAQQERLELEKQAQQEEEDRERLQQEKQENIEREQRERAQQEQLELATQSRAKPGEQGKFSSTVVPIVICIAALLVLLWLLLYTPERTRQDLSVPKVTPSEGAVAATPIRSDILLD